MEQINNIDGTEISPTCESLSLDKISEDLDMLLIRQLELIQEYINLSRQSEVHLRDGYLNLAKSRYIQGSNSISQIRLPTKDSEEYSAVITVTATKNSINETVTKKCAETAEDDSTQKLQICRDTDPSADAKLLRQFGILSSGSVKLAQKGFRNAIEICIERINVTKELCLIQKKFNTLHIIKNKLISEKHMNSEP